MKSGIEVGMTNKWTIAFLNVLKVVSGGLGFVLFMWTPKSGSHLPIYLGLVCVFVLMVVGLASREREEKNGQS
jgi:hypothetical protein